VELNARPCLMIVYTVLQPDAVTGLIVATQVRLPWTYVAAMLERTIDSLHSITTSIRRVICHMGSHSVKCQPTQVNVPPP